MKSPINKEKRLQKIHGAGPNLVQNCNKITNNNHFLAIYFSVIFQFYPLDPDLSVIMNANLDPQP